MSEGERRKKWDHRSEFFSESSKRCRRTESVTEHELKLIIQRLSGGLGGFKWAAAGVFSSAHLWASQICTNCGTHVDAPKVTPDFCFPPLFVNDTIEFSSFIYLPCYHSHSASILISIIRNHLYRQILSLFILYIISSEVYVYLMSVREMKENEIRTPVRSREELWFFSIIWIITC